MSKAKKLTELRAQNHGDPIHRDLRPIHSEASLEKYFKSLLSPEEIERELEQYKDQIETVRGEFKKRTAIHAMDIPFLILATALQCVRQYVLTPFAERTNAEEQSEFMKEKYGKKTKLNGRYYYATKETIIAQPTVPFDIVAGSKKFDLGGEAGKGMSGDSHRFRTLGHDPILGYIFGTANILTNTLTHSDLSSYHIKYKPTAGGAICPQIAENAKTKKMFEKIGDRIKTKEGMTLLVAAIVKEHLHLKSDRSTDGLPIPFLSLISPDLAQTLAEQGLDAVRLGEIGKQASCAMTIDAIIAILHGLFCSISGETDRNLYKVRTRKILLYSNLLATGSNIIYCTLTKSVKKLDVGGMLVTISHLFSDINFFDKIQCEFLNNQLNERYQDRINALSLYYELS